MKVAYSGIEGAFAHIAAMHLYPKEKLISCRSFRDAYEAVEKGNADAAVLPIENSFAGEVGQVTDLMFFGSLSVCRIYEMQIMQNLLAVPGAELSDIRMVISHRQALEQCERFIAEHHFEQESTVNTARAAREVAMTQDIHMGAIASAETAKIYGLQVLVPEINESRDNTTRFAVFMRKEDIPRSTERKGFIMVFTVPDIAGGLAKAINIIGEYGFNMSILRSRPMKELAWNYYFYVEAEGDITSVYGKEMIARLSFWCDKLKIVGQFDIKKSMEEQA